MNIEEIELAKLTVNKTNMRKHTDSQIRKIANNIKKFGFIVPIVVNGENVILAGHGRYFAAKLLKLEKILAVKLTGLTEQEQIELMVKDNQLAELAEWDKMAIAYNFEKLDEELKQYFQKIVKNNLLFEDQNTELPLRQWNRTYKYVIIYTDNDLDYENMKTKFNLGKTKDITFLKSIVIGEENIIEYKDFLKRVKNEN